MSAYYYFIASLPSFSYGEAPPLSSGDFLQQCENFLTPQDASLLRYCALDVTRFASREGVMAETHSAFINAWLFREWSLRLNLVDARSERLGWGWPESVPHDIPRAEAVAKTAAAMSDPLEAELFMDKDRWEAIEAAAGMDYFGVNTIYAYLLKLRLTERKTLFKTEEGFANYKALYAGILESAPRAGANGESI